MTEGEWSESGRGGRSVDGCGGVHASGASASCGRAGSGCSGGGGGGGSGAMPAVDVDVGDLPVLGPTTPFGREGVGGIIGTDALLRSDTLLLDLRNLALYRSAPQ